VAGALAAAKMNIPVVHIEAGLRSFNKRMPEEINRITCDHVSTLLFAPTDIGLSHLHDEGFNIKANSPYSIDNPGVFQCGDLMLDNSLYFSKKSDSVSTILKDLGLESNNYILSTIHRDNNTDIPERLNALFLTLNKIGIENRIPVVIPLHPRTTHLLKKKLTTETYSEIMNSEWIKIIPPVSYLDVVALEKNTQIIMTDSGGVQKEAFFFKKPCVVLRSESEWMELVDNGNNIIADADEEKIVAAYEELMGKSDFTFPEFYGNGRAAYFICERIIEHIGKN
ncbi:MAG: UDP-N-acetylglucosamine 2-epimerase, partial [Flavobacteriales bacterium]|nr:UDP-N-acetylglucosamine 2-epimerase [Flavobacteriales bacterium]